MRILFEQSEIRVKECNVLKMDKKIRGLEILFINDFVNNIIVKIKKSYQSR